ncbi:NUDIX hydrolase [Guptibacillus spartinae]|uniref:NUDIX hydrolase n=1 Tax=Guptibacillus spartinae TaxID=3025679 RepID=UPI002360937B|nr:NUDIX domain-containing protein [Pseudalkalibacillus spartinae]
MPISNYYQELRNKINNELIFIPSVAAIIRNDKNEILYQYPGDGDIWSLPAGAIEPSEAPAQAVVREVREETGLSVRPQNLLGVFGGNDFRFTYANGDKVEYNVFVFECIILGGELSPNDGESVDLQFFSREDKPRLALPYPEEIFYKTPSNNVYFQWREDWLEIK